MYTPGENREDLHLMTLRRVGVEIFQRHIARRATRYPLLVGALVLAGVAATLWQRPLALAADSPNSQSFSEAPALLDDQQNFVVSPERDQVAMENRARSLGRVYPEPNLEEIDVLGSSGGDLRLSKRPSFQTRVGDRYASVTPKNNLVFYTIDPDLQSYVSRIVSDAPANHVAIVAMNPKTGSILAIAGKSVTVPDIEYHAGFPAASLFKVVTAAAAVEEAGIDSNSLIAFRGGTYTLNQSNYLPNPRADRRIMSVGEALGRSCNPVFGSIGLKYLNGSILARYAEKFGFNQPLGFEAPLPTSSASIPDNNAFELSRTAAGFGEVRISPVHAASLMSGIANGGLMPRPQIIERITTREGALLEKPEPETLQRIVQPSTAQSVLEMMRYTTTIGTSRREFMRGTRPTLGDIDVAAKTGTLTGSNPQGLNNWFIAAAPISNPDLAIAVITVDPQRAAKASHLGRLVFQKYFNVAPVPEVSAPARKNRVTQKKHVKKSSHYRVSKKKSSASKKSSKKSSNKRS